MEAGTGSRQHACLDQHPGMRVHQTDPLNVGAPLELLRQAFAPRRTASLCAIMVQCLMWTYTAIA
jgi:hypothetical protein